MYDAIVVGARCAGAPTAMLLARKGYRVLLVDKATFPSETMSTHYVKTPAIATLKRWGLLDRVIASNCPPISTIFFDPGPFVLSGQPPRDGDVAGEYAPRRRVLDKILVDAAVEAGAELREGFAVEELLFDDGRVSGIAGRGRGEAAVRETARIVIGADGMRSRVAEAVQAPAYETHPPLTCSYYSYWSGVPIAGFELYLRPYRAAVAFPTNDDLVCVLLQWPRAEFDEFRRDVEGNFMRTLELAPDLAARIGGGRREERIAGTADLPNFFRQAYGPGWALVGDAGHHKDPSSAQGITDAFRDAEALADALDAGFSGRRPLEEALAGYQQQRDATLPYYNFALQIASLQPPPPETLQLIGALYGNQEAIDQYFGVLETTVPLEEFFSPENIGRIMARAAGRP